MDFAPVYLSPMQGVTDVSFRRLCFGFGCDGAVTEMIETGTYAHTKKKLAEIEAGLVRAPEEKHLLVQLIGRDPADMGWAAERVTAMKRFDGIDINMACPARKVTGGGSGSALMKTPDLAREILRAVLDNTDLPVSLKLRLGWDEEHQNALDIARMAQEMGVKRLTLHGRTRAQHYEGTINPGAMRHVVEGLQIPVVANGDVREAQDADRLMAATGAQAVAIGRATRETPWIFEDIRRYRQGLPPIRRTPAFRAELLCRLARYSASEMPERLAVIRMRKFAPAFFKGLNGLRALCDEVNRIERMDDLEDAVDRFVKRCIDIDA